jgi:ABC-type nitrate/sulfonate/bicarbonate transport system ATPase subunit
MSLSFSQSQNNKPDESQQSDETFNALEALTSALQQEREDWFSELSGGQKSKVELVRKVFLRDHCPSVLLIGE